MEIRFAIEDDGPKGAIVAFDGETEAGKMTFVHNGSKQIIIDHTEVNEKYNGHGIGKKLVYHGAEYFRTKQFKVIPLCPFASALFKKDETLQDLL